jgi:hypothetical protein
MAKVKVGTVVGGAAAGLGLLGASFFGGYSFAERDNPDGSPLERTRTAAERVAKDCGDVALNKVLRSTDRNLKLGKITAEQITQLNGLQAQVEAAQQKCFQDSVGATVGDVSNHLPTPQVGAEVHVTASNPK